MTKFVAPEQFVAVAKTNVETLLSLSTSAFSRIERLTALNLNTARAVLEDAAANVRTVLSAKNPQELAAVQAAVAKPAVEKALAYGRSVYEIVTEGQQEVAKLFEGQIADLNKNVDAALEQAAKNAPAGSEVLFSAAKNAIAAANSAYDNANKAAKQLVQAAEANVANVTAIVKKAA